MIFNVFNWYWIVGGDLTKVYSSKTGDYVLVSDATYVAWLGAGGIATLIDSEVSLGQVLANVTARPVNASILDAYQASQADEVLLHKLFKIAFNHENRLRAIERNLGLNGSPANLTPGQAKVIVKALM